MHYMVDIETLATNSYAPVIEIAVTEFDHANVYRTFQSFVLPDMHKSVPDMDTIAFWARQDIRMPLYADAPPFDEMVQDLRGWLGVIPMEGVWANTPAFDLVILLNSAKAYNIDMPWDRKLYRCFKTVMKTIAPNIGVERVETPMEHDAKSDAIAQAWSIINLNTAMTERGTGIL